MSVIGFRKTLRTNWFCLVFGWAVEGCTPSDADFERHLVSASSAGTRVLNIDIAHNRLAFGPTALRLTRHDAQIGADLFEFDTRIANDGARLTARNIQVYWHSESAPQVCLSGCEQADLLVEIRIEPRSHREREGPCPA